MRIVFMGTPEFAVPNLKKLVKSSHEVVGVVTQPDRPKGRGLHPAASPVKEEAEEVGLPILQPEDLKDPEFLGRLKQLNGDCFVVVGFRILPPVVYEMPPKGTVNLHASLLPKYRGAAPIQWAIVNGEEKTGVSTFFIQKDVDTGDLILQEGVSIGEDETAGELHDRLALVGAGLLLRTVDLVEQNRVKPVPQKGAPTQAPKIKPEHCQIDWGKSAIEIVNRVRGFSPYPGAFTFWNGKRIKIYRSSVVEETPKETDEAGRVVSTSDRGIVVQTGDGKICIQELQVEGKRRMKTGEFLRGYDLPTDVVLG